MEKPMGEVPMNVRFANACFEMENPELDSENPHFHNKYASLQACLAAIKPPLRKYGFSFHQGR